MENGGLWPKTSFPNYLGLIWCRGLFGDLGHGGGRGRGSLCSRGSGVLSTYCTGRGLLSSAGPPSSCRSTCCQAVGKGTVRMNWAPGHLVSLPPQSLGAILYSSPAQGMDMARKRVLRKSLAPELLRVRLSWGRTGPSQTHTTGILRPEPHPLVPYYLRTQIGRSPRGPLCRSLGSLRGMGRW